VTFTQAPLQHWAATTFFFLVKDVDAQAVVATPRFLEPPELEGGVVRFDGAVSSVSPTSSTIPSAPSGLWKQGRQQKRRRQGRGLNGR
jgi:hypothetical protein